MAQSQDQASTTNLNWIQVLGITRDLALSAYFWLVILLGSVLRFYDLGAESYWGDEVVTLRVASQSLPQIIASFRLDEPLAYYLSFSLWIKAFGTGEAVTRSFSALLGIATIFLIYRLGRELFDREIGLLSAFLMAISEFQLFYSQEIRPYTLFECSTLLSFLLFIQALRMKKGVYFVLWAASSILLLASHAYGAFILVAQDLFFLLQLKKHWDVLGKWFLCQLPILLAALLYFLPMILGWWEPIFRSAVLSNQWSPKPSIRALVHSLYWFILPARHSRSWGSVFLTYLVAGGFLVAGIWIYLIRKGKKPSLALLRRLVYAVQQEPGVADKLLLVTCWLLCPIVLPFFLSQVIGRMYQDRYTISAAPAFYLLLAFGMFKIRKVVPMLLSLGALVIMVAPGVHHYYANDMKEQWREAAAFVQANSRVNEVIVFAPDQESFERNNFDWYYRGNLPDCGIKLPAQDGQSISMALAHCISGYQRFWLVMSGPKSMIEPFLEFPLEKNRQEFRLIKMQQFIKIKVSLFELNSGAKAETTRLNSSGTAGK